jgi:hypothetical protein
LRELLKAQRKHMLESADDEVLLAMKMMKLGAARNPRPPGDLSRGRARVAKLVETFDGRIEQPPARLRTSLFL